MSVGEIYSIQNGGVAIVMVTKVPAQMLPIKWGVNHLSS